MYLLDNLSIGLEMRLQEEAGSEESTANFEGRGYGLEECGNVLGGAEGDDNVGVAAGLVVGDLHSDGGGCWDC